MPARRAVPPKAVAVASLMDTNNVAVDRVNIATEQYLQDLQDQQRAGAATAAAQGDALSAVTDRVTALEGEVSGRLLAVQVFTGSGSYTPTSGTTRIRLRMQAPGGPGGGAIATPGVVSLGGGGSSGAYVELWLTGAAVGAGTITIAAAGAPTTGTGPTSGDVTAVIAGNTYTAKGGTSGTGGAQNGTAAVAASLAQGGQPQTGSTSTGTLTAMRGDDGFLYSAAGGGLGHAGNGGQSEMGMPGLIDGLNSQPAAPAGYGGGGGGAFAVNASVVGGPAGPGRIEIEDYS